MQCQCRVHEPVQCIVMCSTQIPSHSFRFPRIGLHYSIPISTEAPEWNVIPSILRFDFVLKDGTHVKGNGYRSLLHSLSSLLLQLHQALLKCTKDRSSMFFLPVDHISNLTAFCRALEVNTHTLTYSVHTFTDLISDPSLHCVPYHHSVCQHKTCPGQLSCRGSSLAEQKCWFDFHLRQLIIL